MASWIVLSFGQCYKKISEVPSSAEVPNLGDASPWGDARGLKLVINWVHLWGGDATDIRGTPDLVYGQVHSLIKISQLSYSFYICTKMIQLSGGFRSIYVFTDVAVGEAGATFDNSFFDNSFIFLRQFKNRSFLVPVFVHVTGHFFFRLGQVRLGQVRLGQVMNFFYQKRDLLVIEVNQF